MAVVGRVRAQQLAAGYAAVSLGLLAALLGWTWNGAAAASTAPFPSLDSVVGPTGDLHSIFQLALTVLLVPRVALAITTALPLGASLLAPALAAQGLVRPALLAAWALSVSVPVLDLRSVALNAYLTTTVVYFFAVPLAIRAAKGGFGTSNAQRQSILLKFLLATLLAATVVAKVVGPAALGLDALVKGQHLLGWVAAVLIVLWDATLVLDLGDVSWTVDDASAIATVANGPAIASVATGAGSKGAGKGAAGAAGAVAVVDPLVLESGFMVFKDYVVDIYLGFIAWSILTALATLIWFFPLFNMSLSGEEAAVVTTLVPIVLGFKAVRGLVLRSQALLLLGSLVAVLGYLVPAPNQRLLICGVGVALSTTVTIATWFQGSVRRNRAVATWLLGLLLSLVVRVFCTTTNPLWPIMNADNGGMQEPLLTVAVVAIVDVLLRSPVPAKVAAADATARPSSGNAVAAGLGFGGALYATHLLFTDTGSLSRFIVAGYPNPGPPPFPHGLSVLVALAVGLLLSTRPRVVASPLWWGAAAAGSAALVYAEGLPAYGGGLVLGVYVMSIWPRTISALTSTHALVSLTTGLVLYNALLFAGVWTVAYAFVPYGELLRERTDIVVAITVGAMLVGAVAGGGDALFAPSGPTGPAAKNTTIAVQIEVGPGTAERNAAASTQAHNQNERRRVINSLMALGVLAALAAFSRIQPTPTPHVLGAPNDKLITGGIWTIHFGYDNAMWASHVRMANLIRDTEVDFVGLLESDTNRLFMGNRDVPLMVAEQLNMYVDYGPRTRDNTWGCALLSKFPIVFSKHYLLPSPDGELACAIHATLDVNGSAVDVLVAHNGQEETPVDRDLQTKLEGEILRNATNPIIFVGYVVTKPHGEFYKNLVNGGNAKDIDPTDSDRWCEYIVYKGLERVGYARVSHGGITDTELQMARFRIGSGRDNADEIPASEVPPALQFTKVFDGAGVRGHRYHVHDRPKYFGTKAAKKARTQPAPAAPEAPAA